MALPAASARTSAAGVFAPEYLAASQELVNVWIAGHVQIDIDHGEDSILRAVHRNIIKGTYEGADLVGDWETHGAPCSCSSESDPKAKLQGLGEPDADHD